MTDWLPTTDRQLIDAAPGPSVAQVERLRLQSIQVLAAAADALQAASDRQRGLHAEIEAAELKLALVRANRAELLDELGMLERRRDAVALALTLAEAAAEAAVEAAAEAAVKTAAEAAAEAAVEAAAEAAMVPEPTPFAPVFVTPGLVVAAPSPSPIDAVARRETHSARLILSRVATGFLIVMLLGLAVLLTPVTQVFGGLELLAVLSGSMEPTIHVGGVVAIRPVPPAELKVGDAITFVNQSSPDVLVTHRVVSMELRDGQTMLTTKGDANDAVDALSAPASRAVGRVEFTLPYLGYLMIYLSSPIAKVVILALAVLGLGLAARQPSSRPPAPAPEANEAKRSAASASYEEHEREILTLLGKS